jgi:hypothetical protein
MQTQEIQQLQKEMQQIVRKQRRNIINMIDRNVKYLCMSIDTDDNRKGRYRRVIFSSLTTLITRLIGMIERYGSNDNTLLLKINQMLINIDDVNDDEHIYGCCEDVNEWMMFYEDFEPNDIIDWF